MTRMLKFKGLALLLGIIWLATLGILTVVRANEDNGTPVLRGRIVAVNIPGASAISAVGTFLPGGPIHDKPAFAAFTQPGKILDPTRILVGSSSNFGAPRANAGQREGSFLSIDASGEDVLAVPDDFAAADGQVSVLGGRVQLYTAQSPAFLNGINNPTAITANFTGVSNPLGISINNAFGRLWPANAPFGLEGFGTSTILDPTGIGLANAPNQTTGGVYADSLTPRLPTQVIPGALSTGAVGTAFLGHSPDGSTRAVFSVVLADGSLVQEHTGKALDGLAGVGTVSPLLGRRWEDDDGTAQEGPQGLTPRLGVVFNWEPTRILYISEPFRDGITVLDITDDGVVFRVAGVRHFFSNWLDGPVDLAPVTIETTDPSFSSNTTLDNNSDFYVANRGSGTIVRMRQDGSVATVRRVLLADGMPLGDARLNGIATSPDGTKIWVTITGHLPGIPHSTGAVLELPSF